MKIGFKMPSSFTTKFLAPKKSFLFERQQNNIDYEDGKCFVIVYKEEDLGQKGILRCKGLVHLKKRSFLIGAYIYIGVVMIIA